MYALLAIMNTAIIPVVIVIILTIVFISNINTAYSWYIIDCRISIHKVLKFSSFSLSLFFCNWLWYLLYLLSAITIATVLATSIPIILVTISAIIDLIFAMYRMEYKLTNSKKIKSRRSIHKILKFLSFSIRELSLDFYNWLCFLLYLLLLITIVTSYATSIPIIIVTILVIIALILAMYRMEDKLTTSKKIKKRNPNLFSRLEILSFSTNKFLFRCAFCLLILSFLLLAIMTIFTLYSFKLPDITFSSKYYNRSSTKAYSFDGQSMSDFMHNTSLVIKLDQIPKILVQSFIASQDNRFFKHQGLDLVNLVREFSNNLKASKILQYGTTITQYVSNLFLLANNNSFIGKIQEIDFACKLEHFLPKNRILYLYLNQVYLGHGIYGIESASQKYFNKTVKDLNLAECAILAGLPPNPENNSPFDHFNKAKARQIYVLNQMVDEKYITKIEAAEAIEYKLYIMPKYSKIKELAYLKENSSKNNNIQSNLYRSSIYQITLNCMYEGIIKNAFYVDEEINVYANCPNKSISLNYNADLSIFTGQPDCTSGTINIVAFKFENQSATFTQKNQKIVIDMVFKKPVFYVLINPGEQLNRPPLNQDSNYFNKFKDQLRLLSHKLDGNQRYWQNRWQRAYFFLQHAGKEPKWLCNQGNIATKWNDPDFINQYNEKIQFQNQSIPNKQLIDDACTFIKGFSISDKLNLKGAAIIVIGVPDTPISSTTLKQLEQKLKEHKVCALIAQFGAKEHDYTNNTFKYLKLIEFDMKTEFLNKFFQPAFERIMKEFTELYDRHQAN